MFVPLHHAPGHAQADVGEALVVIGGVEQKAYFFAFDLPHSDACYVRAYPAATADSRERPAEIADQNTRRCSRRALRVARAGRRFPVIATSFIRVLPPPSRSPQDAAERLQAGCEGAEAGTAGQVAELAAPSCSWSHWTLPLGLRGRASRKTMRRGHL